MYQIKSGTTKKCQCECKIPRKHYACEKNYIWNPSTCTCENDKYLENSTDDSVITCDETIEPVKSIPTKTVLPSFNKKGATCIIDNFYILLTFLLIFILLLTIVSIYGYHIKHRLKEKHVLPYHDINNKSKEIDTNNIS